MVFDDEEADKRFEESVRKFAEAFTALNDEEKAELRAYAEGRADAAEEAYKKNQGKK